MLIFSLGSFGNEKTTQKVILVIFTRGMNSDFGFCLIISIWRLVEWGFIHLFYTKLKGHLLRESGRLLGKKKKFAWEGGEPKVKGHHHHHHLCYSTPKDQIFIRGKCLIFAI